MASHTTPTLLGLKTMRGENGEPLKVVEKIAAGDYMIFGICLLQDENGDEVQVIKKDHKQDGAESVTQAILRKWLISGGPTCTYQHLIECLRQSELGALADDITITIFGKGDAEATHLAAQVSESKLLIQQHIQKQGKLKGVCSVKMLLCGPPKTGKTTTMLRLTNKVRCIDPNGSELPSTVLEKPRTIQLRHMLVGDKKIWNFEESVKKLGQSIYRLILDPFRTTGTRPTIIGATPTISNDRAGSSDNQDTAAVQNIDLEEVTRLAEAEEWVEVNEKLIEFGNITILYVVDSGGQPECHEILPLLLNGHVLGLIFLDLTKELGDNHSVLFRTGETTAYNEKPLSDFTTGEVIQRILTSIWSLQSDRHKSLAVFVGTYLDKATQHQVLDLESAVQSAFRVFIDENIVCPVGVEGDLIKYIETLDNTSSNQRDIERLRVLILRIINERFRHGQEDGVPTGWMLLHLILRDKYQEKGWCTMAECIATAASCGITKNELPYVLKYIHKNYGTILYYPGVLNDIVICDPDVILSPLKSTFEFVFSCEFVTQIIVAKHIRNTGEISQDDLEFCFREGRVSLPTPDVIELFKHCHILCETGSQEFFMPCLLRTDNSIIKEANDPQSLALLDPAPILFVPKSIKVKNCATPLGVFSALVVEMSADGKWECNKSDVCFRNRIQFDVVDRTSGRTHIIELRLYATYIELRHIHVDGPIDTNMLVTFHHDLRNALDRISGQFDHTKAIQWNSGFYCPDSLEKDGPPHLALVKRNIPAVEMTCNLKPRCKHRTNLENKHKIWLEKPEEREKEPTATTGDSSSFLIQQPTDQIVSVEKGPRRRKQRQEIIQYDSSAADAENDAMVDEPNTCPVCKNLLTEPFLTDCGHHVCGKCAQLLATGGADCRVSQLWCIQQSSP